MAAIQIQQLIELAIGFPESGQVNFCALHCLLSYMAQKMGITDDTLIYDEAESEGCQKTLFVKKQDRLIGGLTSAVHNGSNESPNEPPQRDGLNPADANINDETNEQQDDLNPETDGDTANEPHEEEVEASQKDNDITNEEEEEDALEAPAEKAKVIEPLTEVLSMPDVAQQPSSIQLKDRASNSVLSEPLVRTAKEVASEANILDENLSISDNLLTAISMLRQQLEFVMDQLLLLTFIVLSRKPASPQIQQLYTMAQMLNDLKQQHIPLLGLKQSPLPFALSLDWIPTNLKLTVEDFAANVLMPTSASTSHDTLEGHVCYSPAKLLDQLMSLKSEFCLLTNKVNEVSARLLEQEGHHLLSLVQENGKQIHDIKLANVEQKANHSRLELRISNNQAMAEDLKRSLEQLSQNVVEKTHFDTQLAQKADCKQLQGKAALDQMLELQCRLDKRFDEICKRFNENDKTLFETVENLKLTLGPNALHEVLAKFKADISHEMQQLNEMLTNYMAATNDDCAAAGARVQVLQDQTCLSCNTNCVMPVREKSKVAKLPSAHASNIISPLVTYELGSIRKSGLMGYYRKDEFPHSPNAWLAQQSSSATTTTTTTRHAGGQPTTHRAKEIFAKIMRNSK